MQPEVNSHGNVVKEGATLCTCTSHFSICFVDFEAVDVACYISSRSSLLTNHEHLLTFAVFVGDCFAASFDVLRKGSRSSLAMHFLRRPSKPQGRTEKHSGLRECGEKLIRFFLLVGLNDVILFVTVHTPCMH